MNRGLKTAINIFLIAALVFTALPMQAAAAESTLGKPGNFSASGSTYNSIRIKWSTVSGAFGYQLFRGDKKKGKYKKIKTLPASAASFVDKKRKPGRSYYYKMRAYAKSGGKTIYSGYTAVKKAKGTVGKPQNFRAAATSVSDRAKLSWKKVSGVSHYRIYRATSKNGKYKLIKKVSGSKTVYYDKSKKKGATYYYKIRAAKKYRGKTYYSGYTAKKKVCVKYAIMGKNSVTAGQLASYYRKHAKYPSYYASNGKDRSADTLEKFCQMYIDECSAEGVKAEVAFCQAMLETGWLSFKGDVKISQFNFAGIGATGGGRGGSSFSDVRTGIRAQVQHLKAYACKSALNRPCADPRFKYVKRGSATYTEWLGIKENPKGGGWAASKNYGYKIMDLVRKIG